MEGRTLDKLLTGSMLDFRDVAGPDLFRRTEPFYDWQVGRRALGLWPYGKFVTGVIDAEMRVDLDARFGAASINFATADHLSLSKHPEIISAAERAIADFGLHSAGAANHLGNTALSQQLEIELGDFLKTEHVQLFPTGWGARYGVFQGLIRPSDHIVMDASCHAYRHEGAWTSSRNVYLYPHLEVEAVRRTLARIRSRDTSNAVLVVTDGIFAMESDAPDLAGLQEAAAEYGAFLMVDLANDLGALGPDGRGHLGLQEMVGRIDILIGSFSNTFASNGGFVATRSPAAKQYLSWFSGSSAHSNALSPIQAGIVLACLRIIRAKEGLERREALMRNVIELRGSLAQEGLPFLGIPSPVVPVVVGTEDIARLASGIVSSLGAVVNLAEFPSVAKGRARFVLQVMTSHSTRHIRQVAVALRRAVDEGLSIRAQLEATVTSHGVPG